MEWIYQQTAVKLEYLVWMRKKSWMDWQYQVCNSMEFSADCIEIWGYLIVIRIIKFASVCTLHGSNDQISKKISYVQDQQCNFSQSYGSDTRFDSSWRMILKHDMPGRKQGCAIYLERRMVQQILFHARNYSGNIKMVDIYGNQSAPQNERLLQHETQSSSARYSQWFPA